MKIDCGPSWKTKFEAKKKWHVWFAWRPVRVGENDCRWLELVKRKGAFHSSISDCWWEWEYRPYNAASSIEPTNGSVKKK